MGTNALSCQQADELSSLPNLQSFNEYIYSINSPIVDGASEGAKRIGELQKITADISLSEAAKYAHQNLNTKP